MGKQSERIDRELKLINAVHGIPRLWQKSDEKYKDQTSKGPIWTKLAKSCGYTDGKAASLAWKNLRGNYVDKLNKKKASTGSGLDDVQMDADDHKYAGEFAFLLPELEDRPSRPLTTNSPVDAWGMNGIADDGNSMEALNGDPMLSSTASNSN